MAILRMFKEKKKPTLDENVGDCRMTEYCDFCYEKERFPTLKQENDQLKQQLTESKKIIKDLLWSESHYCEGEEFCNIRSRAEIFIE